MTDSEAQKPVLYEDEVLRLNEWSEPASWVLAVCAFLAGAYFLFAFGPPWAGSPGHLLFGVAWLVFGALIWSAARVGVIVCSDGVLIRTYLHESHRNWEEIAEFSLRHSVYRPGLQVRLVSGAEIKGLGLAGRSAGEWELAENMVSELNCRLKQKTLDAVRQGSGG